MAKRQFLTDATRNARRAAAPKQHRVTVITGGMKYVPGQPPVQVCPRGVTQGAAGSIANPMMRKI